MPYFENQGAQLYYEERGQGKPLIFLHGFGLDGGQWKRETEHFSSKYRVITLDARGHGRSTLPQGRVSPDIFWQDVIALMDYLSVSKAIICGLSMGGHVALQVAINGGARVESLILIGAICTNQFNRYERYVVPVNRVCQRMMPMGLLAWSISVALGHNTETKQYIRKAVETMSHDVYNRTWKAVTSMESRNGLGSITCPVLLLIGDGDTLTRRQQTYMHERIQDSRIVTIRHASHGTNLDNPKQVEEEIEKFLNSV